MELMENLQTVSDAVKQVREEFLDIYFIL